MYSNRMLRKDQSLQRMIVSILLLMSYSHRHRYQRFACNAYHLPNRYNIHLVGNTDTNDSLVRCEFGGGGRNQDGGISRRNLLKDLKRKGEVTVLGNIVYNFNTEDVLAGDRMELKKRKKKSTRLDYRFFVAGGACAAVSHGVTTPIDVIKTKMQAEPERYTEGVIRATTSILNEDGLSILLGGLGPTIVGYGFEGAAKFGIYEGLKPILSSIIQTDENTIPFLLASTIAGAIASIMLCPIESTRIRIVTDSGFAKGLLDGLPRLVREEGFLSIFAGILPMLAKQVPYTITKQVSFDIIAGTLYVAAFGQFIPDYELKPLVSFGSAFLASILSCLASHPGDVLLTETYKDKEQRGIAYISADIFEKNGMWGFFRGLDARLFHVVFIITSQLILYDVIKQGLGLPATGSH